MIFGTKWCEMKNKKKNKKNNKNNKNNKKKNSIKTNISSGVLSDKEHWKDESSHSKSYDELFLNECNNVLRTMKDEWGVSSASSFTFEMQIPLTRSTLESVQSAIIVTESWNKALAFRSMISESLIGRWRILTAISSIADDTEGTSSAFEPIKSTPVNMRSSMLLRLDSIGISDLTACKSDQRQAMYLVEKNIDPLACSFGVNMHNIEALIVGLIDMAVRELCPHNQIIHREAYRALKGSKDPDKSISNSFVHENECKSLDDYCMMFARYGLKPKYWLDFCNAFIWTMKTHNPYANQEQEIDDFSKPTDQSAHAIFVAGMIVLPILEASLRDEHYMQQRIFLQLQHAYESFQDELSIETFKNSFDVLFQEHPDLGDHFGQDEIDNLLFDLLVMMQLMVKNLRNGIRTYDSDVRKALAKQGEIWLQKQIPLDFVALFGKEYIDTIHPYFCKKMGPSLAKKLDIALAYLYKEAMHFIMHPLVVDKNLRDAVSEFYNEVASELDWSKGVLEKRMVEINLEILTTGTYTQTSQEIEIGARLAWRNSGKCIGRIAWNTLKVRDCRHLFSADTIFHEIEEHIRIASGGTNIQSVMTVFRPQQPNEAWGMRFWSSQLFRYAGYKEGTNEILGDPANAEFTEYLIKLNLWTPPATRTGFDLLPLVLKMPHINKPFVHTIPQDLRHEVDLEHPQFPAVKELGLKWAAIPAISNFKMTIGGLNYPCMPFNGWFMSTEIARNLLERYKMTFPLAKAMNIPLNDRMISQKVAAEVENVILHSFEKQEYTIVDPMTIGKSFMTHCKRERESGRECPAQWSWIGGLVGPTNPTWHLEMRDFKKNPQYEYASNPWQVITIDDNPDLDDDLDTLQNTMITPLTKENEVKAKLPRVLIAFGSETGNAEVAAYSLARKLKLCRPKVMSLNDATRTVEKIAEEYTHLLTICSTFGSGEPPSNAKLFFDTELDNLNRVSCATLALGSTLYPKFCQAGKNLETMIRDAGGDTLAKLTLVDSVNDSQSLILQWSEQISKLVLPDSLIADLALKGPVSEKNSVDTVYNLKWKQGYGNLINELKRFTFPPESTMSCTRNYELFSMGDISTRSTRHIEFALPVDITYKTGDHLAVSPINDLSMVQRFLNCFSYELEKAAEENGYSPQALSPEVERDNGNICSPSIIWQVHQPFDVIFDQNGETLSAGINYLANRTLVEVVQLNLDLSLDKESYAMDLLSMMKNRLDKSSISPPLSNTFNEFYDNRRKNEAPSYPTIIHLLEAFGSMFCKPLPDSMTPLISLADVLVLMPRLNPRYYSISSCAQISPSKVAITVGVVNFETITGQKEKGVCSHYLASLKPGDKAKNSVKTSTFRAPQNKGAPIIMVGSGTGLAPLMGLLRKRSKDWYTGSNRKVRDCHLFFGCRSRREILYRDELTSWKSAKIIQLHLALSRDERVLKQYVQDQLKLNRVKVNSLLQNEETHFYICGDTKMAAECTIMCIEILTTNGGMSRVAAIQHINQMRVDNRWQYDLYGTSDSSEAFQEKKYPKGMTAMAGSIWTEHFLRTKAI